MGKNCTEIPHHTYQIKSTHFYPVTNVTIYMYPSVMLGSTLSYSGFCIYTIGIVGLSPQK